MTPFRPEGGLSLSLARAACVAGQLSLFGTLAFRSFVAPRVLSRATASEAARICRRLHRIAQIGAAAAVAGLMLWLLLQTADLADSSSVPQTLAAVPVVLASTTFGHVVVLQFLMLLAIAAMLGRQRLASGLGLVELALQAGHSHAYAMDSGPNLLLASNLVHLWAAGAWLGGLLPLLFLVHDSAPKLGAAAARWFSPLGKLCVAALAASALFQGWIMIASLAGLVGTAYGWMALAKLALFGVLFAFAVANRYWLAPALLRDDPAAAKRRLVASIAVQTGFGLAIVAAASLLSNLPPPMHHQPAPRVEAPADVTPLTFAGPVQEIWTDQRVGTSGDRQDHAE